MYSHWLANIEKAERYLKSTDPKLGALIDNLGPENWQHYQQQPFHALLHAIIGQQLSTKAAKAIEGRIRALLPNEQSTWPKALLELTIEDLRTAGLSQAKTRTVQTLSEKVHQNPQEFIALCQASNKDVHRVLCAIPGIGPWTVDMFLMFGLNRLDVFSGRDLGLRKAIALHFELDNRPSAAECDTLAERWKPYRTVAAWHLWRLVD